MQESLDYKHLLLLLDIHMMQQGTIELLIFSRYLFPLVLFPRAPSPLVPAFIISRELLCKKQRKRTSTKQLQCGLTKQFTQKKVLGRIASD